MQHIWWQLFSTSDCNFWWRKYQSSMSRNNESWCHLLCWCRPILTRITDETLLKKQKPQTCTGPRGRYNPSYLNPSKQMDMGANTWTKFTIFSGSVSNIFIERFYVQVTNTVHLGSTNLLHRTASSPSVHSFKSIQQLLKRWYHETAQVYMYV